MFGGKKGGRKMNFKGGKGGKNKGKKYLSFIQSLKVNDNDLDYL